MARKLKSDKLIFLATLLLLCASVVMVYSASALLAMDRYGQPPYAFLFRQVTWAVLGVCLLSLAMRVDYRVLREPVVVWSALGVSLVALVAVFFGPEVGGTRRWLGFGGVGVQPSELAKVALIIYTAAMLEQRMEKIDQLTYALGPIAIMTALVCGLIVLEPDYGTALALLLIVSVMVFAAGLRYRYIIGTALVMVPLLAAILASADYRRRRFTAFLDPWADPLGDGFQTIQSQIAVGTGGLFGQGLMAGVQKLFYLPEPHTDFIYAVIAEETGLLGATIAMLGFGVIVWRGLRVTAAAPDQFGSFLALGLTMMVALQAFVNMSVVLGLLPITGITLPFVSYGGSSLLVSLLGMGILLNVSQHASSTTA